jgi:hypothetical protein
MAYELRKTFTENLPILVKSENEQLFRILKASGENFSENANGIFFDVNGLTPDTFEKMNDYMQLCLSMRKSDETRITEMNKYRAEMKV